jgi:hypothetical protein
MRELLTRNRNETREQETHPADPEQAVEAALTGFAVNGGSWMSGRDAFRRAERNGRSVNEALTSALAMAEGAAPRDAEQRTESTLSEAKVRFWDNMDPNREDDSQPTPAIERALTGYAKDGGSWLEARDAFYEAIDKGVDPDEALDAALALASDESETHPEVAKDRFYGGVDPDYAEADHFAGRKYGIRIHDADSGAKIEVGIGPDVRRRRQRQLGKLAAEHGKK